MPETAFASDDLKKKTRYKTFLFKRPMPTDSVVSVFLHNI